MAREYLEIEFKGIDEESSGILVAELGELGFSGFEEESGILKAYAEKDSIKEDSLEKILLRYKLSCTKRVIPETNWNKEWESNFQPLIIDDWVAIRAHFHQPIKSTKHEIIITPKMSFGTGHHATTRMMIKMMNEINCDGKVVLDIGTGTGILSILAEKKNASSVTAIDNDEWSIENAKENALANGCQRIRIIKSGELTLRGQFDIILANINRNYIIENLDSIAGLMSADATLLISGIVEQDRVPVIKKASDCSLRIFAELKEEAWIALGFTH